MTTFSFNRIRTCILLALCGVLPCALPGHQPEASARNTVSRAALAEEEAPVFVVRTASGTSVRGPLIKLATDWTVRVGTGLGKVVPGEKVLTVRQENLARPAPPSDEHLILMNGDRVPVRNLKLDGERLLFQHPDLNDGKESVVPLAAVAVFWRLAPDKTIFPERLRRQLAVAKRKRDMVLLRNGDVLAGVLNALDDKAVEVEVDKKSVPVKIHQVAAVALSTELADKFRPKDVYARLVLTGSPGGRLSLVGASSDGKYLRGKTAFGALVRVPVARVAALDLFGGKAVYLSDLTPSKYEYRPFLDERWPWTADSNVSGGDLRVGGGVYDKGLGMHSHSLLSYPLGGAYRRFEAIVGLDDSEGRGGMARVRVLGDGKALDIGGGGEVSQASGPLTLSVPVEGVKELTLEVGWGDNGLVRGVVDWADARVVR